MSTSKTIAAHARLVLGDAENVPSPCISVCRMDAASGLCEGCLRTLDEIGRWSSMTDAGKRAVWRLIGQRLVARQENLP